MMLKRWLICLFIVAIAVTGCFRRGAQVCKYLKEMDKNIVKCKYDGKGFIVTYKLSKEIYSFERMYGFDRHALGEAVITLMLPIVAERVDENSLPFNFLTVYFIRHDGSKYKCAYTRKNTNYCQNPSKLDLFNCFDSDCKDV